MPLLKVDPLNQIIATRVGRLTSRNSEAFTANGTWTRPSEVYKVYVTMVAGGGGGGANSGQGGGSGAYCFRVPLYTAQDLTITVGAGGDGEINGGAAATNGGDTSVTATGLSLVADGGIADGGAGGDWYGEGAGGGAGATGTKVTSFPGFATSAEFWGGSGGGAGAGAGGVNPGSGNTGGAGDWLGVGGDPGNPGEDGTGYGSGGGAGGTGQNGGDGADGFVLIEWDQENTA